MRAEDEDMSNALMNDMADALRSAGLGSMIESEEQKVATEPEPNPVEEDEVSVETVTSQVSAVDESSIEEQVQALIQEGEYKSRSSSLKRLSLHSTKR